MTKARVKRGYLSSSQDEGEGEKWPIESGLEFQKPEKLHNRDIAANDRQDSDLGWARCFDGSSVIMFIIVECPQYEC